MFLIVRKIYLFLYRIHVKIDSFIKKIIFLISACVLYTLSSCSFEHVLSLPVVHYNSETAELLIVQTDTMAQDTVIINFEGLYSKTLLVKDTLSFNLNKIVKEFDQIQFAYNLATHNNKQTFSVQTSRTNDTVFIYSYNTKDIVPINVATAMSGNCVGLYDVNYKRNYRNKIRLWLFKKKLNPDSLLIENINSLIRQFNYSGHNEYAKISGNPPILKTLKGTMYRFNVNMPGKYFYLYAAQDENSIRSFIEKKISEGLKDAQTSTSERFICKQSGKGGPNCLFMVGIDENWKYTIVPLGVVFVDNMAPKFTRGHRSNNRLYPSYSLSGLSSSGSSSSWPSRIYLKSQNVLVNFPEPPTPLTSSVSISYGSFEGNDYFGYNIPFYIDVTGDIQIITIGTHKLDAKKVRSGECIRLNMKGLHIGDNSIPLSAIDLRGNKSTSSLSISIVSHRNDSSYDDNDYDDLDSRISDIERRLDDLE